MVYNPDTEYKTKTVEDLSVVEAGSIQDTDTVLLTQGSTLKKSSITALFTKVFQLLAATFSGKANQICKVSSGDGSLVPTDTLVDEANRLVVGKPLKLAEVSIGYDGSFTPSGFEATGVPFSLVFDPNVGLLLWLANAEAPYRVLIGRVGQSGGPPS